MVITHFDNIPMVHTNNSLANVLMTMASDIGDQLGFELMDTKTEDSTTVMFG